MERRCRKLRNLVLVPQALAVISCALALLVAQPPTSRNIAAETAKIAKMERQVALLLEPVAVECVFALPSRNSVGRREIISSREQRFVIERFLLAPPVG